MLTLFSEETARSNVSVTFDLTSDTSGLGKLCRPLKALIALNDLGFFALALASTRSIPAWNMLRLNNVMSP